MNIKNQAEIIMDISDEAFKCGYLCALEVVKKFGIEKVDKIKDEVLASAKELARKKTLKWIDKHPELSKKG